MVMEPFYIRRKKGGRCEELTFKPKHEGPELLHLEFFLVSKDWIAQKIKKIIEVGVYLEKII